jgi:hypothetical protein
MPVPDFSPGEVLTAAAMDSIGLWLLETRTTSGATVDFFNKLSADYLNYSIIITTTALSSSIDTTLQLANNTTVIGGTDYTNGGWRIDYPSNGAIATNNVIGVGSFAIGRLNNGDTFSTSRINLYQPAIATPTNTDVTYNDGRFAGQFIGRHNLSTAYNGFRLNMVASWQGTVSLYGMRQ